jgi:hypothetical protein
MYFEPPIARIFKYTHEMYLSGYVTTPASRLSSRRVEKTPRRRRMKKSILKRRRVVMATIGSLGDLHPYIALALEMRKRYVEPVIATSNAYRGAALAVDLIMDQIYERSVERFRSVA